MQLDAFVDGHLVVILVIAALVVVGTWHDHHDTEEQS